MDGVLVHSTAVLIKYYCSLVRRPHTAFSECGLGEEVACKLQAEPNNPDFLATAFG